MTKPRRAAILLPNIRSSAEAEIDALAGQFVACQLYAANHDLEVIGRCETRPDGAVTRSLPHHALTVVEGCDVEVVLTVSPDDDYEAALELRNAIEKLRSADVEVVLVDAAKGRTDAAAAQ